MQRFVSGLTLGLLLSATVPIGAKEIQDAKKVFSLDIPDAWTVSKQRQQSIYSNSSNTAALCLTSLDVKYPTLDPWVAEEKKFHPKAKVSEETLGGVAARRIEFNDAEGYKNTVWIAMKGKKGAIVTLVYNKNCPEDMPAVSKKLLSSFRWK